MKFKTLLLLSLLLATKAFATYSTGHPGLPLPRDVEKKLNLSAVNAPLVQLGTQVTQKKLNVMKAVYDFAVLGGASGTTVVLKDASGGQAVLPANAIIKQVATEELTNVTVAAGGTISLGINSTVDLLAATAGATFAGIQAGIPTGIAANMVKVTSSDKAVTASFATNSTTAGKLNVFIEYYLSNT